MDKRDIVRKRPAEKLLHDLVRAFAAQEEIKDVYSFGSVSTGESDIYSDVDLSVISYDAALTCQHLKQTLSLVGAPEAIYVIYEDSDSAAYTIMLADQSPYQKVDIGITSIARPLELFENSTLQYISSKDSTVNNKPIEPMIQSEADNQLVDCLLGSVRYLKHMHRKEQWAAYKFYRGFMDQHLRLELNTDSDKKLTLDNFKELDKKKKKLEELMFISSAREMNNTFLKYLDKHIEQRHNDAVISEQYYHYARNIIGFWHEEIKRIN